MRGRGYIKSLADIENIVLKTAQGVPLRVKDVARVEIGPDERRGVTELNGEGEVASGIVLQRFGANALDVIDNVKQRLADIAGNLPKGAEIVPVYDRSHLIEAAIDTLQHTLTEESIIVALVCVIFLLHLRSALVAILMLPVGILIAFIGMKLIGLGAHIMSLGGIALAVGAMIDAAIVMIENARKHLEGRSARRALRVQMLIDAASEGRPGAVLQPLDHHRVVPADLHAGDRRRAAVRSARLHQDLLDGSSRAAIGDIGAGADGRLHARQDRQEHQRTRSTSS